MLSEEFRKSEDYKQLYALVRDEHPNMPHWLVEASIYFHKKNPQWYKQQRTSRSAANHLEERDVRRNVHSYELQTVSIEEPQQLSSVEINEVLQDPNKQQ